MSQAPWRNWTIFSANLPSFQSVKKQKNSRKSWAADDPAPTGFLPGLCCLTEAESVPVTICRDHLQLRLWPVAAIECSDSARLAGEPMFRIGAYEYLEISIAIA